MSKWTPEYQDERSPIPLIPSDMKGGTARPWATQRINDILSKAETAPQTFEEFVAETDITYGDPNHEVTAHQKLAVAWQGNNPVDKLIQEFEVHGPPSLLGDVGLVDQFEQVLNPHLQESIYHLPHAHHLGGVEAEVLNLGQPVEMLPIIPRPFPL